MWRGDGRPLLGWRLIQYHLVQRFYGFELLFLLEQTHQRGQLAWTIHLVCIVVCVRIGSQFVLHQLFLSQLIVQLLLLRLFRFRIPEILFLLQVYGLLQQCLLLFDLLTFFGRELVLNGGFRLFGALFGRILLQLLSKPIAWSNERSGLFNLVENVPELEFVN